MTIHRAWIRVTATAAIVAGASAQPATAQYAPYQPVAQQPAATTPAAPAASSSAQPPAYWQQAARQTAPSRYETPSAAQYPQTVAPYVPSASAVPTVVPATSAAQYPTAGYPAYSYLAQQPTEAGREANGLPAPVRNGATVNGKDVQANGHAANGHTMHNGQPMPANGGYVYPQDGACNSGYATSYPGGSYYQGDTGADYGIGSYFDNPCHDSQWFGGMYFLFMERDNPTPQKLTVEVDHAVAPDPYYPRANTTVLGTHFVDHDYREGVEFRVGSTFTISSSCDTCDTGCYNGCNSCAPRAVDVYAWEVAWWGLDDDVEMYAFSDDLGDTRRIYGMKNFAGLEYDRDGAGGAWGYRGVNEYYGYDLPINDPGAGPYADGYVAVLAQYVRTNFKAQNLELNIIRFPVYEMACTGCDTGCDSGCNTCQPACVPRAFSMYGSCGVRYFRVDDDFMYANEFTEWAGGTPDKPGGHDGFYDGESNEMYYDVQVENHLIGPQVGFTMNYAYACKWNFFCNSTFGFFNNHIEHVQQMWGGGDGVVRFQDSGEEFYVESSKNDFSFLGELRLGGSYDINCNWRAVAAYRAVAIAGLATSTDQIPDEFTNAEWVAIIDSDNSMIIHGLQLGAECRY